MNDSSDRFGICVNAFESLMACLRDLNYQIAAGNVSCPTLFIHGEKETAELSVDTCSTASGV